MEKAPLPIIETDEFGLTEREVLKAKRDAEETVQEWREAVNGSENEELREVAPRFLRVWERRLKALSVQPGEIILRVRTFYDRTVELGNSGLNGEELNLQLSDEFPDMTDFYSLLRMRPWGYRLGQIMMAIKTTKR